ncbi:phosphate regulon sensor histidine kinase PhoR [Alkanindiges illinoisensis]|uniref:Phosphate regulon sensor protein PhoR n=1 Tax=Alkanindiges illinoisensis TaxID=197183 RepID=A0A4Y7XCB2_9GAMM|nr:phosphate regulon sensor histidine kinase PhoR [Alkanindiges illinoisensis]
MNLKSLNFKRFNLKNLQPQRLPPNTLPIWRDLVKDLRLCLVLLIIAAVIGLLSHALWPCLVIALVLFIGLQFRAFYQIYYWIRFQPEQNPPELSGVLGEILYLLYRYQRQEKQAKTELINTIARAQTSISALQDAVVLIDSKQHLEWWNPAAEQVLGLKAVDVQRPVLNIIRDPEFAHYFENLHDYPNGIKLDSWVKPQHFIQCEVTPFGDHEFLLLAYDITHLHRLEQMRKDFVANVSHELRTPLTVISGYLEMLGEQQDVSARWQRAFKQMQQQTRRMNALVNDLLLLSRLENEELTNKDQVIHMASLLNELFDDAQAYNSDYGHTLNLHIESHCNLLGSKLEIASAFSNLITNAIKYTPKGGVIHIGWSSDQEHGYFYVEDNGIGIEAYHIPRLTERFYRVDSARSRDSGGTGLGLAIVKHVLAQHEGYLDIQSKIGQGTTFKAVFAQSRLVE